MTWQSVFFSSNGRIGQKDYWIAALILVCAWIVSPILHLLIFPAWILLAYCWICIISKRLHDAGHSGWLILVPAAAGMLALIISVVIGSISAIGAFAMGFSSHMDPSSWAVLWGSLGAIAFLFGLAGLVKLVFLLWVGLSAGQAGDNRYGPAPTPWIRSAPPPAPARPAA